MGKVYTRTGDRGDTRLFDSTPVRKDDARVETYGDVDELNATIGVAVAMIGDAEVREFLLDIQRQLLSLGAQLADPKWETRASAKGRLDPAWVGEFEARIDRYQWQLPVLQKFTLSGGGPGGAMLHLARTVCRRAERSVVRLARTTDVAPGIIEYLNRLSDLLFVLARVINHREGREEIQW
jgi:cob(I)alamin adenosyltransferase